MYLFQRNAFCSKASKRCTLIQSCASLIPMAISDSPYASWPRSNGAAFALAQQNGTLSGTEDGPAELPKQLDRAYQLLLAGKMEVEIQQTLSREFGIGARPRLAYAKALALVIEEQRRRAENLPELLMATRWAAISAALACRQFSAVAAMLRDAEATIPGGTLPEALAELRVEVMERRQRELG